MRSLSLRPFAAASSARARSSLPVSPYPGLRRALSSTPAVLEESKQEVAQPRGVPLAFDLGGINITNQGPRITFAQRLAARNELRAKAEGAAQPEAKAATTKLHVSSARAPYHGAGDRARPGAAGSSPQSNKAGFTPRPKGPNGGPSGGNTSPAQRGPRGAATGGSPGWSGLGKPPSEIGQRPKTRKGPVSPQQAGQRAQGANGGQGKGFFDAKTDANAFSRNRRAKRPMKKKAQTSNTNTYTVRGPTDPELNDYAGGPDRQPTRKYDEDGILVLKGEHAQISQPIRPVLPTFAPHRLPATIQVRVSGSVETSLRIASYADRAMPGAAGQPKKNVLGIMDNAQLALSRVRDLEARPRNKALSIVRKMADPPAASGNRAR
ncbi:hypothetical protein M0805_004126 [Coniferiporia weirii]|nr:hypothetical protein M0805_004126 [Coniferiporia weirii]